LFDIGTDGVGKVENWTRVPIINHLAAISEVLCIEVRRLSVIRGEVGPARGDENKGAVLANLGLVASCTVVGVGGDVVSASFVCFLHLVEVLWLMVIDPVHLVVRRVILEVLIVRVLVVVREVVIVPLIVSHDVASIRVVDSGGVGSGIDLVDFVGEDNSVEAALGITRFETVSIPVEWIKILALEDGLIV
jgi:hypothetical protein